MNKSDWTYKKLGEVATYVNGYAFKPETWSDKGLPIIRIQNLNNANAAYNYYAGELPEKYIVENGDLLISWSASLGAYYWEGEKAFLNQHIFKVVFDKSDILKGFLKYAVEAKLEEMKRKVHGATMQHIVKKDFDNTLIPVPPLSIQQLIVEELDAIHSIIENKKQQVAELDNLAQSLFYQMFGDPITNPMGWEVKKLGEVAELFRGLTYKKSDEVEISSKGVLRSNNIELSSHALNFEEIKYLREDIIIPQDKIVKKGSIFICMSNGSMQHLGKVAYIDKDYGYAFGGFMGLISPRENIIPRYLFFNLLFPAFLSTIIKEGRGANINNLKFSDITNFSIPLPPLSLQQSFAEKVEAIEAQKARIQESIQHTEALLAQRMDNYFG